MVFSEASTVTSVKEDNIPQFHNYLIVDALSTESDRDNDTRSAIHHRLRRLKTRQASENNNVFNIFEHLKQQISGLQVAAATSLNVQVDSERSRQVSSVKHLISYKLIKILKRPLTKHVGLYDILFSSVLQRYPLQMIIPCSFGIYKCFSGLDMQYVHHHQS